MSTNTPSASAQSTERPVLVISSINRDTTFTVPALPLPGETKLSTSKSHALGGKGANTAVAAARSGAPEVHFVGAVGAADGTADGDLRSLSRAGVRVERVARVAGVETGQAVILLGEGVERENAIVVDAGANLQVRADVARGCAQMRAQLRRRAVVVLHLEIAHEAVQQVAADARAGGGYVVLNPSPVPETGSALLRADATLWKNVDVLIVNEVELDLLSGGDGVCNYNMHDGDDNVREKVARMRVARGVRADAAVVVTLGARGAALVSTGSGAVERVAAPVVRGVVDTTGAGDCVSGFMAGSLARGLSLGEALRVGVRAASLCVQKRGASESMPTLREVEEGVADGGGAEIAGAS